MRAIQLRLISGTCLADKAYMWAVKIPSLSMILGLALAVAACGNRGGVQQPAAAGDSQETSGASLSSSCTKKSCPSANMGVDASGEVPGSGTLVAYVGDENDWLFDGLDLDGEGRTVAILVDNWPKGAEISPEPGKGTPRESLTITHTPSTTGQGDEELTVIKRDMDKCLLRETEKFCNSWNFRKDYDQKQKFTWESIRRSDVEDAMAQAGIDGELDGNTIRIADPGCDGAGPPTTDGEILGTAISTGTQILKGDPMSSAMGIIGMMIQNGQKEKPPEGECL